MPSQPSLQACSKRISPSPSKNSFKTIPGCGPRTSFASLRLRYSMDERRKSSPSSSIRSKAIRMASPPWRSRRIKSNTARPLALVTMASPSSRNEFAGSAPTASAASGNRDVKSTAVTCHEPHTGRIAACHDAKTVVFDLVNPIRTGRRGLSG